MQRALTTGAGFLLAALLAGGLLAALGCANRHTDTETANTTRPADLWNGLLADDPATVERWVRRLPEITQQPGFEQWQYTSVEPDAAAIDGTRVDLTPGIAQRWYPAIETLPIDAQIPIFIAFSDLFGGMAESLASADPASARLAATVMSGLYLRMAESAASKPNASVDARRADVDRRLRTLKEDVGTADARD